jgi:hypothetical protein
MKLFYFYSNHETLVGMSSYFEEGEEKENLFRIRPGFSD